MATEPSLLRYRQPIDDEKRPQKTRFVSFTCSSKGMCKGKQPIATESLVNYQPMGGNYDDLCLK
jgi:hypothetical protein